MPRLSVYIMAQNEAKRIRHTLESVKDIADELVVIDGGSTDETVAICREYTDTVIVHRFEGYALQRKFALTQVTGDWILAIDADETLSPELRTAIPSLLIATDVDAYDFSRRNYVKPEIFLRYGGFYPDYQRRLFRKGTAQYGSVVHAGEVPTITGRVCRIDMDILHDQTENNVQYHISKLMRFVHAEIRETQPTHGPLYYLYHAFRDPLLLVYKQYIIREGYRMGILGIRSAASHASMRFLINVGLTRKAFRGRTVQAQQVTP
jgi:glycosyltransferase involved in cell wall biosynthesis